MPFSRAISHPGTETPGSCIADKAILYHLSHKGSLNDTQVCTRYFSVQKTLSDMVMDMIMSSAK